LQSHLYFARGNFLSATSNPIVGRGDKERERVTGGPEGVMLKISIVLVTTTAFAALLIAYPFSPHPAAQASGAVAEVATVPPQEPHPTTPGATPVGIASLSPAAALATGETGTLPARTGPVATDMTTGRGNAPARLTRSDPDRPVDPRIPPRPSHVERQGKNTAAPVTYPRAELVARPAPARGEIPAGSTITRYPGQTSGAPVYLPPGATLVDHDSVGRLSARPHRAPRYRSLALAPDQPVR
jgi:hypothetical protein